MTPGQFFDALILGQGLAGSLLAWTLAQRGWSVCVLDEGLASSSSRAAAGLINPVTGKRLAKTPEVDWLLPQAERFYRGLEQALGLSFLHWVPMAKLLRSTEDVQTADRRLGDPDYQAYLGPRLAPGELDPNIVAPLGALIQKGTGYLDSRSLIEHLAHRLREDGRLVGQRVETEQLRPRNTEVKCEGLKAARLILCQGYKAMHSPLTAWLPFQPAKGEILVLESPAPLPEQILNGGRWLLPVGEQRLKLGATYDWERLDDQPTCKARRSLLESLAGLVRLERPRLVEHLAGVRPATLDNAPFIGRHPHHPSVWIFNGFGSKGSLQIPGYAQLLADHLETGRDLPARVDVQRYASRFLGLR